MISFSQQPIADSEISAVSPQEKGQATRLDRILWLIVFVILVSGLVSGILRGLSNKPNWGSLTVESRWVWEHRASSPGTKMFGYLPTAVFALWPFTVWLPQPLGLCLYVAVNTMAVGLALWIAARYWYSAAIPHISIAIPAVLIAPNLANVIQANQLTLLSLLPLMAGLVLVGRGRQMSGGFLVGVAGLIKVLPLFLAGYLLLTRKWRALLGLLGAVIVLDLIPSAAFFGWQGMCREHADWLERGSAYSNVLQIRQPLGMLDHASNFSFSIVLAHWLRGIGDADERVIIEGPAPAGIIEEQQSRLTPGQTLVLAPTPPRDGQPWAIRFEPITGVHRFHIAEFSASAVIAIWAGVLLTGLILLGWFTWGARSNTSDWPAVTAVWILAMFFVTPMMRHYYLAFALPPLVVIWRTLARELDRRQGRWTAGTRLAAAVMILWLAGDLLLGWNLGRWYGLHIFVLIVVLVAAAWSWRCLLRCEEKVPL